MRSLVRSATFQNAPGGSPITWQNPDEGGTFYSRDAIATGTISSPALGDLTLGDSDTGFLFSGVWVYPTGT